MNAAFLAPPFAGYAKITRYCRFLGIQLVLLQIPASRSGRQAWAGFFFLDRRADGTGAATAAAAAAAAAGRFRRWRLAAAGPLSSAGRPEVRAAAPLRDCDTSHQGPRNPGRAVTAAAAAPCASMPVRLHPGLSTAAVSGGSFLLPVGSCGGGLYALHVGAAA